MKLIVGLGNPGSCYKDSRHNIGFNVIKALGRSYKIPLKNNRGCFSLNGKAQIGGEIVMLAMPLTFMNLSGKGVSALLKKYRITLENLLVVCDDLDLGFGRLRLRPSGSSGGHRGLESIIDSLGSRGFARLRIGLGRPLEDKDAAGYVLSPFNKKEKAQVKEITKRAAACCQDWVTKGITQTMNIFNVRSKTDD